MPRVKESIRLGGAAKSLTTNMIGRLFITCLFGFFLLILLTDLPRVSIFVADLLFCIYLCSIFRQKKRFIFLLHPFILLISSQFFSTSFLELGDGRVYLAVVNQYSGPAEFSSLFESFSILDAFKYMSLGAAPVFLIPESLYGAPEGGVYYLWQGCFHVIIVALCVTLAKSWRVIQDEYLLLIALFAIVSPSFFDLGHAPTRHIVTFSAVFLFYISFIALIQKFSIYRLAGLLVAVMLVAISKVALFIPILIFCTYFILFDGKGALTLKKILILFGVTTVVSLGFNYFYSMFLAYSAMSSGGGASFSGLVNIPILGLAFKYLYALLAPFPWKNALEFTETFYGGNGLLFFMHMLSSLTGVYFLGRLIIFGKPLLKHYPGVRPLMIFGIIMSLSILLGSTGFHTYLLIYFPFFAPLFAIKRYQLSFLFPIGFVLLVEIVVTVVSI